MATAEKTTIEKEVTTTVKEEAVVLTLSPAEAIDVLRALTITRRHAPMSSAFSSRLLEIGKSLQKAGVPLPPPLPPRYRNPLAFL